MGTVMERRPWPGPHKYTDELGYTYYDGYLYMGRTPIPPLPPRVAMTDRTSGDLSVLSHSGSPGSLTINLIPVLPSYTDVQTYGPYEGPYIGHWRLYLDGSVILAERVIEPHSNSIISTRRNNDRTMLRLGIDGDDGSVTYTEYSV